MRVALGTMVMRGTGEPGGVGVDEGRGVELGRTVGIGDSVGVGVRRMQAASVSIINNSHKKRFIFRSLAPVSPNTFCTSGPISRILSPDQGRGGGHLSRATVTRHLEQPTRRSMNAGRIPPSYRGAVTRFSPAWPCSRRGLPGRPGRPERRWALTPPFHHRLAVTRQSVSVALSAGHPAWVLPSVAPYEVRTFLDLCLAQCAAARPARTHRSS
jgi:hypothetical protein